MDINKWLSQPWGQGPFFSSGHWAGSWQAGLGHGNTTWAPIATTISFNLISIMSICYGIFLVPKTAWYPLPVICSKDWAFWFSWVLVELVSTPFSQQNVRPTLNPCEQVKQLQNGRLGN